ncbi:head-tail adaptor protein [Sphingomonas sp. Leaf10]|uniref:phage head completion protein n=1 Tax=Sphingomonas sp. Leaf10 TaxID=1735676 RepID=UPI0007011EEB|nr:head-tail adaptor protein [Sphingomonas sp. Leaf10]KQM37621.1 hypothetical protein ASE59_14145 [Sphingomonas sp. Leaf10]
MKPSRLDKRIQIERPGPPVHNGTQNVPGPPIVVWKRSAQFIGSPGRERYSNAETAAAMPALFRIRWDSKIDPDAVGGLSVKDRLRCPARPDGQLWEIVSVVPVGRQDAIDIGVVRIVR